MPTMEQREALTRVDFDHVFIVTDTGHIHDFPGNVGDHFAPDVYHDSDGDIDIQPGQYGDDWEALTGYTGQYGYNGAVMHQSETLTGGLAENILTTPGIYAVVPVSDASDGVDAGELVGWTVCRAKTLVTPLDVWLRIPEDEEEAEAEANIYLIGGAYYAKWYLTAVGLVTAVRFDTYREASEWLTREGFQDFSA